MSHQPPPLITGRFEMRRAEAQLDVAAAVRRPVEELVTPGDAVGQIRVEDLDHRRGQLQHIGDRAADPGGRGHAGDVFRRMIEGQDALLRIGGADAVYGTASDEFREVERNRTTMRFRRRVLKRIG